MAVTTTAGSGLQRSIERSVETGTANTPLTSTLTGKRRELRLVTVKYSAPPTYAIGALTITITSGAGSAYDCVINSNAAANLQNYAFLPNFIIPIREDDTITVLAPAGGVGITAAVAIY